MFVITGTQSMSHTQREMFVNEPKDELVCNWDTKRNANVPDVLNGGICS